MGLMRSNVGHDTSSMMKKTLGLINKILALPKPSTPTCSEGSGGGTCFNGAFGTVLFLPVSFHKVFTEKYGVAITAPVKLVGESAMRRLKMLFQTTLREERFFAHTALEFRPYLFLLRAFAVVVILFIVIVGLKVGVHC